MKSLAVLGLALALPIGLAGQAPDGQALYREHCRTCHGTTGRPTQRALDQYPKIPRLSDSIFMSKLSQDSIVALLEHGKGKDMKSFKDKLTPAEMVAVAQYVRTLAAPKP